LNEKNRGIMPTISKEDYLKIILKNEISSDSSTSTTYLAREMNVSKAAVTDMSKKMAEQGLVSYIPYKGVKLKSKGRNIALAIIRRHRLWELFLIKSLGLSWGEVHQEAELLEHSTSDYLIDVIDEKLGFPKFDPHGEPIPDKNGKLPKLPKSICLTDGEVGNSYEFIKLNDESTELINYLTSIGFQLNTKFKIINKLTFDNSIVIEIKRTSFSLSEKIANKIEMIQNELEVNS